MSARLSNQQTAAVVALAGAIVEAVEAAGTLGAPGGVLYAALQGRMTADHFNQFMSALVAAGRLRKDGHLYFVAAS